MASIIWQKPTLIVIYNILDYRILYMVLFLIGPRKMGIYYVFVSLPTGSDGV